MTTPPPAAPQPQPAAPLTEPQDKNIAGWEYLSASLGFLIPLILWLVYKDRGPRANNEGKEALNFGIVVTAAYIVSAIVFGIISGIVIASWQPSAADIFSGNWGGPAGLWVVTLLQWIVNVGIFVVALLWGLKGKGVVDAGGAYRYPFNIRLIK